MNPMAKMKKTNVAQKNFYPTPSDTISYGRQCIDDDDIAAVIEVLKSKFITQGSKIQEFESALCNALEASFAVAVNSGTSALHIACLAAGIGLEDEVITSPNTFVASANCAVYCGAKPVFADIDPRTYNISPQEIEKKISERTKAIIPVHFAGQSCDMGVIREIARVAEKKYGHKIYIIEEYHCFLIGFSDDPFSFSKASSLLRNSSGSLVIPWVRKHLNVCCNSLSLVKTTPPSPVVICLTG